MVQHILFDCDGVLIDTEMVAAEVVTDWLQSQNVVITLEEYIAHYTGRTFTSIIDELILKKRMKAQLHLKAAISELDNEVRKLQRPIHGVNDMLHSFSTDCSVVSNSDLDYVELALEKLNIADRFRGNVFSANMVERGKPDPAVYHLALKTIAQNPSSVLVVEDSVTGVQAARGAGLKTIGFLGGSHVRSGLGDRLKKAGAHVLVKDHAELAHLLSSG